MEEFSHIPSPVSCSSGAMTGTFLFPGIWLSLLDMAQPRLTFHHSGGGKILLLHYCRCGRVRWHPEGGGDISLGPGEFSLHALSHCTRSELKLVKEGYQGMLLWLDLTQLRRCPPQILADVPILGQDWEQKLPPEGQPVFFGGDSQSEGIFRWFFDQPQPLQLAYQKLKTLELLLYLHQAQPDPPPLCQADQMEVIRQIHEQLLHNLDKRITIEELSRQYLMNPTTMKALFKSAYGTSLAAHMKEHRMVQAARLLVSTDLSIAEIALAVGYDSPSKFSTAFKTYFHVLPKEYRKSRR